MEKDLVVMDRNVGFTMSESELIFPRLTMIQPTSPVNGTGYVLNITGEVFEKVNCIFFKKILGRVMFNPDRSKQEAICGSNDRILSADRFPNPIKTRCVDCDFHRRNYTEGEKPNIKQCDETITMIGMLIDEVMPFNIIFKRTAIIPINLFLTSLLFKAQVKKLMIHNFIVEMSVKLIVRPQQKYYIPVFINTETKIDAMFEAMFEKVKDYNLDKSNDIDKEAPISDEEGVL